MSGRGFVGPVGSDVALPGFVHKVGAPLLVYRVLVKRFGVKVVEALGAALACGKCCPPYAMNVRCVQRAARRPTCSGIANALWARRFYSCVYSRLFAFDLWTLACLCNTSPSHCAQA